MDNYLENAVLKSNIKDLSYVSQIDILAVDIEKEVVTCETLYWRDGDHWTADGDKLFGARIVEKIGKEIGL